MEKHVRFRWFHTYAIDLEPPIFSHKFFITIAIHPWLADLQWVLWPKPFRILSVYFFLIFSFLLSLSLSLFLSFFLSHSLSHSLSLSLSLSFPRNWRLVLFLTSTLYITLHYFNSFFKIIYLQMENKILLEFSLVDRVIYFTSH